MPQCPLPKAMITKGHMKHVENQLNAMRKKLAAGLPSRNSQCVEGTVRDIDTLLAYATRKLKEA